MMFTDIHSHILHGIDDGPETIEESLGMIEKAAEMNITTIYATPHCFLSSPLTEDILKEKTEELNSKKQQDTRIEYGCEVMIEDSLPKFMEKNRWMCLGNSNMLLVELPIFNYPLYVNEVLYRLNLMGIRPVLAHPERYVFAHKDMDRFLDEVLEYADLQINAGSINGSYGKTAKKAARNLIKRNAVTYIATDAHDKRTYNQLKDAYSTFQKYRNKEEADKIFFYNPLLVSNG